MKHLHLALLLPLLMMMACTQEAKAPPAAKPIATAVAPTLKPEAKPEVKGEMPRQRDKKKDKKTVLGWVEKVTLSGSEHTVKAKLDSGAKTSSVDAEIVKTFKRDGKKFVLYRVMLDDNISETYESRIIRWVRIKMKNGGFQRRPVVKMHFCIGKKKLVGEVSLAERGHFIYPVLVGRNMLEKGDILVDTSRTFLSKPDCKK